MKLMQSLRRLIGLEPGIELARATVKRSRAAMRVPRDEAGVESVLSGELWLAALGLSEAQADRLARRYALVSWLALVAMAWGLVCLAYAVGHPAQDWGELLPAATWTALVAGLGARARWQADQLRARRTTAFRRWLVSLGAVGEGRS